MSTWNAGVARPFRAVRGRRMTSGLACSSLLQLLPLINLVKVSIFRGAHAYFKLWPLPNNPFGALGSPNAWRGTGAPTEDGCRSIMDDEENNGNAIEDGQQCGAGTENRWQSLSSPSCRNEDKSKDCSQLAQIEI